MKKQFTTTKKNSSRSTSVSDEMHDLIAQYANATSPQQQDELLKQIKEQANHDYT